MTEGFGDENFSISWEDDDGSWGFPFLVNSSETIQQRKEKEIINLDSLQEKEKEAVPPATAPAPPPPPALPPLPVTPGRGKKKGGGGGNKGKGVAKFGSESDHEIHIQTERERRKKMRDMFDTLHSLLPQLPAKADKSTIVDEAVNYIRALEQTLKALKKKKFERMQGMAVSAPPKVAMSREAFLAEQGAAGSSSNSTIAAASPPFANLPFPPFFQTYTFPNVVVNTVGLDGQFSICAPKKPGLFTAISYVMDKYKLQVLTAQIVSHENISMFLLHTCANGPSEQFPEALPVEEMYKQAAGEIMQWIKY